MRSIAFSAVIRIGLLLSITGLTGCATPAVIPNVAQQPVKEVTASETAKPIQFKKIVIKLHRGDKIGAVEAGIFCAPAGDLVHHGGKADITDDDLTETFQSELKTANYEVVGDPNALFDDPSTWRAEILVAGMVSSLRANICYPMAGFGDYDSVKGEAYMKVDWQIYSRLDRKVVYQVTTEGVAKRTSATSGGGTDLFLDAFAQATSNLLGDQAFHDLVTAKMDAAAKSTTASFTQTSIISPTNYSGAISSHIDQIIPNVVTVFANDGHGSGFFLDNKGHLLTNEHVVRTAEKVTIRFANGTEQVAKVIVTDARRDVALLSLDQATTPGLPIRSTSPIVSDKVYAMGSPLDADLQSTLTAGIVGAFRKMDGYDFIQSDVNIRPGNSGGPLLDAAGNVIGISDLARLDDQNGGQAGLNFFIPIIDALKALNITQIAAN
jgi:S1-C subfamily serine protease